MIEITFNGFNLSDYLNFTGVERGMASAMNITTIENATDGIEVVKAKRSEKEILLEYHANPKFDPNYLRRLLAPILSVKEKGVLVFSDEPTLYYNAIPTGNLTFTDNGQIADGKITFLVPDGKAHATTRAVLNSENSGGKFGTITDLGDGNLSILIKNNGTEKAYPKITIKNKVETGYISLVNENNIFALGKKEEADGISWQNSELYYDTKIFGSFSKFVDVSGISASPQNSELGVNGTITQQADGLRLENAGTAKDNQIASGGMKVYEFPADSNGYVGAKNFYSYINLFSWAGVLGQTGYLQVLYCDKNNNLVLGYGIKKDDMSGNIGKTEFYVGGNNPRIVQTIDFLTNNGEGSLPNRNTMFNSHSGHTDVVKTGAKLEFYWKGSRIPFTIPELENVEIAKCFIYIGQFKKSNKYLTNLACRSISLQKNNVDYWRDIPNRYPEKSRIELDSEEGTVKVDGTFRNQDKLTGSNFIVLPSGESTLLIDTSYFTKTAPEIEISWEEVYL